MAIDPRDSETAKGWRRWINATTVGLTVLLLTVAASIVQVVHASRLATPTGKTVLRISHWQLEAGYRDALDWVIKEYQKLHPDVHIEQVAITERVYGQWLNCQLISNEAPDLAEMGMTTRATDDSYTLRYFQPLSEIVAQPNHYNAGTPLEGVPWKESFIDGMRGGYRPQLLEYYSVPPTLVTTRVYVNVDLLEKATGSSKLPRTFGEYLAACRMLEEYGARTGQKIVPAASCYKMDDWMILSKYRTGFTSKYEGELDTDLDGIIKPLETYIGYMKGKISFKSPEVVAYYEAMLAMADTFGKGFAAVDRQQAQFRFNQGQAAFLITGSWDAAGLKQRFDKLGWRLAVIDNPLPAKGEKWGEFISGTNNEASIGGGGSYGVYKFSKNKGTAIDFLKFLTSYKTNAEFNNRALWLPIVIGAEVDPLMKPFMPKSEGYTANIDLRIGSQVADVLTGQETLFFNREISYDMMAAEVDKTIRNPSFGGVKAFSIEYDRLMNDARSQERVLANMSARMLLGDGSTTTGETEADMQLKYRKALIQHVRKNNGQEVNFRFRELTGKPIPPVM
jgi:raffinose/stachyose/melibiose transport system substrate-binding protein